MTGILVVNKPMDYTSHDCIAILKGLTHEKKIGHTGTLDPNATGVLPVCFGMATRLIEYMEVVPKSYHCKAKFGFESNTDDIWGELKQVPFSDFPSMKNVEEALASFVGEIEQYPPMYSAVRVNGRRLYSYARAGETVEVKPRKVQIFEAELTGYYPCQGEIDFNITCSRGTYIRTICHDLGDKLKVPCVMSALVRTKTSGFDISQSIDFEELRKMSSEEIESKLFGIDKAIYGLEKLQLDDKLVFAFSNGLTVINEGPDCDALAVLSGPSLIGIAKRSDNKLRPVKVFHDESN